MSLTSGGMHLQIEMEERMISLPQKARGCLSGHSPLENQRPSLHSIRWPDEAAVSQSAKASKAADHTELSVVLPFSWLEPVKQFLSAAA